MDTQMDRAVTATVITGEDTEVVTEVVMAVVVVLGIECQA